VRGVALALLAIALLAAASGPARAHPPDSLGVPDPQWQRFPDAPAESDAPPPRPDAANATDGGNPESGGLRVLEMIVYGFITLAALLALSLVHSFWSTRRPADAPRDAVEVEERST